VSYRKVILGAAAVFALAACGSGSNNSASSAASASAPAAAPTSAATSAGAMENVGKYMGKVAAPIPSGLTCGADQPVWVNTRTHKYHEPDSPMYGKTKAGKYMCPSDAKAEGDTAAGGGMRHHKRGSNR